MEHIIAVKSEGEFRHYHKISQEIQPVLEPFLKLLETKYDAADLPNAIVWTSLEIATQSISRSLFPATPMNSELYSALTLRPGGISI